MELNCSAEVEFEDAQERSWTLSVHSTGEVFITAPCGEMAEFQGVGRKGKFFSNLLRAYKKAASAINIYDTKAEEAKKKYCDICSGSGDLNPCSSGEHFCCDDCLCEDCS